MRPLCIILLAIGALACRAARADTVPTDSDVLRATRQSLPTMQPTETEHYVLLTDAPVESARQVASLLEATWRSFQRTCAMLELKPAPLRHKLVAVLFREKGDYTRFARAEDGMNRAWAVGYYSPGVDRLVMFDAISDDAVQKALAELQVETLRLQKQTAVSGGPLDAGPAAAQAASVQRQIDAQRQRVIAEARGGFMGTVSHEAAHQLLFHTGVQRRDVPYPLWLAEGLATSFEGTDRDRREMGFQFDNPRRLDAMRDAMRADRLVPLKALLVADRVPGGDDEAAVRDFYAQACALTTWMARERPTELRKYLDALRDGGFAVAPARLESFERVFGASDAVERCWLRHEVRQSAPLADSAPAQRVQAFDRAPAQGGGSAAGR
jgi:hypothetical protein